MAQLTFQYLDQNNYQKYRLQSQNLFELIKFKQLIKFLGLLKVGIHMETDIKNN